MGDVASIVREGRDRALAVLARFLGYTGDETPIFFRSEERWHLLASEWDRQFDVGPGDPTHILALLIRDRLDCRLVLLDRDGREIA